MSDESATKLLKRFQALFFGKIRISHPSVDIAEHMKFFTDRMQACNGTYIVKDDDTLVVTMDKDKPVKKRKAVDIRIFWGMLTGIQMNDDGTAVFGHKLEHSMGLRMTLDTFLFNVFSVASLLYVHPYKMSYLKNHLPRDHEVIMAFPPDVCKSMNTTAQDLSEIVMQCVRLFDVQPGDFRTEANKLCELLRIKLQVFEDTVSFCRILLQHDKHLNHAVYSATVVDFPLPDLTVGSYVSWDRVKRSFVLTDEIQLPVSQHLFSIWEQTRHIADKTLPSLPSVTTVIGDAAQIGQGKQLWKLQQLATRMQSDAGNSTVPEQRRVPVGYVQTLRDVYDKLDEILDRVNTAVNKPVVDPSADLKNLKGVIECMSAPIHKQEAEELRIKLQHMQKQNDMLQSKVTLLCRQNVELNRSQCNVTSSQYVTWCRNRMQYLVKQEHRLQQLCLEYSERTSQKRCMKDAGTQTMNCSAAEFQDERVQDKLRFCILSVQECMQEVCAIKRTANFDVSHMQKLSTLLQRRGAVPMNAAVTMSEQQPPPATATVSQGLYSSTHGSSLPEWGYTSMTQEPVDVNSVVESLSDSFGENLWN